MSALPVESLTRSAPHLHIWHLRAVEYDNFGEVQLFECDECAAVHYA